MNLRDKIAEIMCGQCEEQTHRLGCCTDVLLKDTCLALSKITNLFRSEPATVECEECKGKGYKKSYLVKTEIGNFFLYTCPSCIDGQRMLMKVRKCPRSHGGNFSNGKLFIFVNTEIGTEMKECPVCKGTGKITEPLTFADIDWGKSKLKLKKGWEVEE